MSALIKKLYHLEFLSRIFHTTVYCLKQELKGCYSVLDIGCGPDSPIQYCQWIKRRVGVEPFKPYLEQSKLKKIHTVYINRKIEKLRFPKESFDAVVMIEVLEHLDKKTGKKVLKMAEGWAKKKVIVTTPNGFVTQKCLDGNKMQKHLSGWGRTDLTELGYRSRGLSGLKILRSNEEKTMMGVDLTTSIRLKPKLFWFVVATLSQSFTYFMPDFSFETFNVKNK